MFWDTSTGGVANPRKLSIPDSAAVSQNKYFPSRTLVKKGQKTQKDPRRILRES
ncbi:hypothetical protein F110043I8_37510 [Ruminococcus sp. f11]